MDTPAYSLAEASRLTGLSKWQVSSYLRGYRYQYEYHSRIKRISKPKVVDQSMRGSTFASFLDVADLLVIKELLRRKFSLQFLRKALQEAKEILGSPHFARSTFYTHPNEIIVKLPKDGNMIALMTGKQSAMPEFIEKLSEKLDFEDITEFGFAQRYYPAGRSNPIVVDPQICFGFPTIVKRGVQTANIYDLYLGENKKIKPVSRWFDLPDTEVEAAIQYERSL